MLLRVGIAMALFAVALAAVVAVVVNLRGRGEADAPAVAPVESRSAETTAQPSGKRDTTTLPVVAQDWPAAFGRGGRRRTGPPLLPAGRGG
jgi:hypothetical protein